jgi:hypothetical protein
MFFVAAAGRSMQFLTRVLFAFFFLLTGTVMPTFPQNSQSRLVLFLAPEPPESYVLLFKNADGKILSDAKWLKGFPLYREFILPPKEYTILFPGPVKSIEIGTSSDVPTFVYYGAAENGTQITTWRGEPNPTITKALSDLKKIGVNVDPVRLDLGPEGTKIFLSTDPPWPNPFDPPAPPPAPKK